MKGLDVPAGDVPLRANPQGLKAGARHDKNGNAETATADGKFGSLLRTMGRSHDASSEEGAVRARAAGPGAKAGPGRARTLEDATDTPAAFEKTLLAGLIQHDQGAAPPIAPVASDQAAPLILGGTSDERGQPAQEAADASPADGIAASLALSGARSPQGAVAGQPPVAGQGQAASGAAAAGEELQAGPTLPTGADNALTAADGATADLPRISVTHRETHFEPVRPYTPAEHEAGAKDAPTATERAKSARRDATTQIADPVVKTRETGAKANERGTGPLQAAPTGDVAAARTALPASELQRIAGSVAAEADTAARESTRPSPAADMPGKATGGPVRILNIQLHPVELGLVSVRMRLVGNGLEMQMQASRGETAELLKRDRETLSNLLRSAGYSPDLLTVRGAGDPPLPQPSQNAGNGAGTAGQQQAQSQFGGWSGGEASDGRSGREPDNARNHGYAGEQTGHDEAPGTGRDTGGVYV